MTGNVVYQDRVVWRKNYGLKDKNHPGYPPDQDTVFRVASITKIFTVSIIFCRLISSLGDHQSPLSFIYCNVEEPSALKLLILMRHAMKQLITKLESRCIFGGIRRVVLNARCSGGSRRAKGL